MPRPVSQTAQASSQLVLRPEPRAWETSLKQFANGLPDESRLLREQLGLPIDKPIILTGHQAQFWHPGILAKYLAADSAADRFNAHAAWLVVDQDVNNPWPVRYPIRLSNGRIEERTWEPSSGQQATTDTPTCWRSTISPAPLPQSNEPFATPEVNHGLDQIAQALAKHTNEPNAARQIAAALTDLMADLIKPRPVLFATQLNATTSFANLVAKMQDDPAGCVNAYNTAAAAHTDSGIRPLECTQSRVELPLWKIVDNRRMPVFASDLETTSIETLLPRALFMTGILRRGACELFIHGTGGEAYDTVTEQWFNQWLGQPLAAATAAVSATQLLELETDRPPTAAELNESKQLARKARHDPNLIGDTQTAQAKRQLVEQIAQKKEAGENSASLFAQMQQLLSDYRKNNEPAFARLDRQAAHLELLASEADLLNDRTWPFALYASSAMAQLKQEFTSHF